MANSAPTPTIIVGPIKTTYVGRSTAELNVLSSEMLCLAKNVYFEARNQSHRGQFAVAQVTLNRAASPYWPNTVCDVVYEGVKTSQDTYVRNKCQFSWVCDGSRHEIHEAEAWEQAVEVSKKILLHNDVPDVTQGAVFYHHVGINPYWAESSRKEHTITIGAHKFYKFNI